VGGETDTAIAALADDIVTGLWRAPRGFKPDVRPAGGLRGTVKDAKAIGRDLRVRYLVRAGARRESGLMLVNVQLLEAESARQLWVGSFDYRLDHPAAQGRMAARIGRVLAGELLRAEVRRPLPARPGAAHYTMLGRALMAEEANARTTSEAIAYLEKPIRSSSSLWLTTPGQFRPQASAAGWRRTSRTPRSQRPRRRSNGRSSSSRMARACI
jgi:TolB-like protein